MDRDAVMRMLDTELQEEEEFDAHGEHDICDEEDEDDLLVPRR